MWHGEAAAAMVAAEQMVPRSSVVAKNQEEYPGSKPSQPQVRPHSPGLQLREDKAPYLLAINTSEGCGSGRKFCFFRRVHLKGPHRLRTFTNPTTLGFTTRATAGRAPVTYRKQMKWLETGPVLGKPPGARQGHFPLSELSPCTEPQSRLPRPGKYLRLHPI